MTRDDFQARLDEGLCVECGEEPHLSDGALCSTCRTHMWEGQQTGFGDFR